MAAFAAPAVPNADVLAPAAAVGGGGSGIVFTGLGTSIVQPCASTILAGLGFQPNEPITVTLGKETIGKTNAETNGSFSTPVTIPAGTAPGTYILASVGATGFSSSTDLTVGTAGCRVVPHLSQSTVIPGETTVVSGSGCVPETPVVLTIAGKEVGHTTANSQGHFSARITPPGNGVGEVTVTATCGSRTFAVLLNLVATSKGLSPEGSTAVFAVFVLLGIFLLRGLFTSGAGRRRRKRQGASDVLGKS
jgi:hypothetical protein